MWQPEGHLGKLGNFPCYDPAKVCDGWGLQPSSFGDACKLAEVCSSSSNKLKAVSLLLLLAQDLVLPPMFSPHKYTQSPLLGGPPRERQIFAFFKGRLLTHVPKYSRGLRQFLDKYCSK